MTRTSYEQLLVEASQDLPNDFLFQRVIEGALKEGLFPNARALGQRFSVSASQVNRWVHRRSMPTLGARALMLDVLKSMASPWQPVATAPSNVVVETKVDDGQGVRNVQALKRIRGLWFFPDAHMYVYYDPTHWRPLS